MKQNLIIFPSGCYGTFFEWLFNFLENPSIELPFCSTGSSHNFVGNVLSPNERLYEYISSDDKRRFSRLHFGIFEKKDCIDGAYVDEYHKIIHKELKFLAEYFDNMMVITYDQGSVLWQQNNGFDKSFFTDEIFDEYLGKYGHSREYYKPYFTSDTVQRLKHIIDLEVKSELSPFRVTNLLGWNKHSIYDFDLWELRELLSLYWFTRTSGEIDALEKNKLLHQDKILFISLADIKYNFIDTVIKSARHFDVPVSNEMIDKLKEVHQQWLPLQKQINKDEICSEIIESLLGKVLLDWSHCDLSILDEAWIQKTLRHNQIEIKCHGLDVFPTNTTDFLPLLLKEKP
jgi:uncharacterized protein YdcH (DUF465 family)